MVIQHRANEYATWTDTWLQAAVIHLWKCGHYSIIVVILLFAIKLVIPNLAKQQQAPSLTALLLPIHALWDAGVFCDTLGILMVQTRPCIQKLLLGVCKLCSQLLSSLQTVAIISCIIYSRFYVFPKADYIILSSVLSSVVFLWPPRAVTGPHFHPVSQYTLKSRCILTLTRQCHSILHSQAMCNTPIIVDVENQTNIILGSGGKRHPRLSEPTCLPRWWIWVDDKSPPIGHYTATRRSGLSSYVPLERWGTFLHCSICWLTFIPNVSCEMSKDALSYTWCQLGSISHCVQG